LVKGVRFTDHRDAGSPHTTARAHNAQGADELLLIDIDGFRGGCGPDMEAVSKVARECFMPLTVGGGITSVALARNAFEAGADKILVNGGALDAPSLVQELATSYGSQAIVVAIDVVGGPGVYRLFDHRSRSVLDRPWLDWLKQAADLGAGEVRLMAVDREGARSGMDLGLFEVARRQIDLPIILEGGAADLGDLSAAMRAGVDAVGVGTLLVFADNNLVKVRRYLAGDGHEMRI
jgi:cyclase